MTDFAAVVRRYMNERDMSLRQLAAAAHYDVGGLSKVLNGHRPRSGYLAKRLDDALGAGGKIIAAATPEETLKPGRKPARAGGRETSGAVEALQVAMNSEPDAADFAAGSLAELVTHYAQAAAVTPSASVYDELMSARSFAGTLLGRAAPAARPELTVTTGWLSSLLAVSATDLGDHAAAIVWCHDAERRGTEAGYAELLGWAALTRSLIAWYQGDPVRSAVAARHGQAVGQPGTAAHAKLAAQEMRCLARLGDAAGMQAARQRAAAAMATLGPSVATTGVYSVPRSADPPYTATSLMLAGRHAEAAEMTRRIIDTAYQPKSRAPGDQPTHYARTLLILGLAAAGMGELDEAAAAGTAALECGRVVWPTLVLAGKLSQSLGRKPLSSPQAADFHDRYAEARTRLALPAGRSPTVEERR
jgi:transcriptional regulator with XRE-family HTH domain